MRRIVAAAIAVLLAACGELSNQELEDLAFLDALPSAQELALRTPGDGSVEETGGATGTREDALRICDPRSPINVFCYGHHLVMQVNRFTWSTLTLLDVIRGMPGAATERREHFRAWGPYPDDARPGGRWRVEVARSPEDGGLHYTWRILLWAPRAADADFVEVVTGSFVPGPGGTSKGEGIFTWNAGEGRRRGLGGVEDDPERMVFRYALQAWPKRVAADIEANDGNVATVASVHRADGSGGWEIDWAGPIGEGPNPPDGTFEIRSRWGVDRSGRAELAITVDRPILPGPFFVRECWAPTLERTFFDSDDPQHCPASGCPVGDEATCAFEPLF